MPRQPTGLPRWGEVCAADPEVWPEAFMSTPAALATSFMNDPG
jgi:hypothetical protein